MFLSKIWFFLIALAAAVAITVALVIWHGPDTDLVANAFEEIGRAHV